MRELGKIQKEIIRCMADHGAWHDRGCGWVWSTGRETEKILKSIETRGLVSSSRRKRGGTVYILTTLGKVVAKEVK